MAVRGVPAWWRVCDRLRPSVLVLAVVVANAPRASAAAVMAPAGPAAPIGVHSMLYLDTPFGAMAALFKQAASVGGSEIRLDIELSGVFVNPGSEPDWNGVDEYMSLARRYHLRVLADLTATPWWMAACPAGVAFAQSYRCAPGNPGMWGAMAGEIAAHTAGVIDDFEIINEADGSWAFLGTPQQYAQILAASYVAIHAANRDARVALGGLMNVGAQGVAWMDAVFATPGVDALHDFDIANIHIRTPNPLDAGVVVRSWRHYFASNGFHGPLWVTETGYPADPAFQTETGYRDGAVSQARWMATAIPDMLASGAAMVFVTERDNLTGPYASEGVLRGANPLTAAPIFTRRPSFYAVRALAVRLRIDEARRPPVPRHPI